MIGYVANWSDIALVSIKDPAALYSWFSGAPVVFMAGEEKYSQSVLFSLASSPGCSTPTHLTQFHPRLPAGAQSSSVGVGQASSSGVSPLIRMKALAHSGSVRTAATLISFV